jgi:hypothetical protein
MLVLAWLVRTALFAALSGSLALAASLRALIVSAASRLGQNTILLDFAVETLQRQFKLITGIDLDLTHERYQPFPELLRSPESCLW